MRARARGAADVPTPTVTAKGSAGDEDVPDLTIRQVTLKAGETLLVSCNDEGGDAEVYWGDASLHQDVASQGAGFYTTIFTLYSATGGTADIVASHVSGGDLTINAYAVTNLAPSALDKMAAAQGSGNESLIGSHRDHEPCQRVPVGNDRTMSPTPGDRHMDRRVHLWRTVQEYGRDQRGRGRLQDGVLDRCVHGGEGRHRQRCLDCRHCHLRHKRRA